MVCAGMRDRRAGLGIDPEHRESERQRFSEEAGATKLAGLTGLGATGHLRD